jgi:hypothetical protein
MTGIVVQLRRWDHRRLQRLMRTTRDAGVRTRSLIVLHAATGKGTARIADAVGYDPSAVLKVLHRYRAEGDEGLRDHREDCAFRSWATPSAGERPLPPIAVACPG